MAMTLEEIAGLLDAASIKFQRDSKGALVIPTETSVYKDDNGDQVLFLILQLLENGEYFQLFTPMAFKVTGPHVDVFLKACSIVQWRTKMIQFEYDDADGEIRPIIEFPLEDAKLTSAQLIRCIKGMVALIDAYYPVLDRARREGVIDFPAAQAGDVSGVIDSLASQFPAEVLGEALRRSIAMRQRPIPS